MKQLEPLSIIRGLEFPDYFYSIEICFVLQKPNKQTSKLILFKSIGMQLIE